MTSSESQPLVSVIVPVYNVERYLRACLDSLLSQTMRSLEIICVDDGSTDESAAILSDSAARDKRIRIIAQENAGQGAARNRALEVARAPYIMFCDSDDWYEPDMCEKMLRAIEEEPRADMAVCGYYTEWEREKEPNEPDGWCEEVEFQGFQPADEQVIKRCIVGPPFKIYRREFLETNRIRFPEGYRYEDFYFWYVCAAHSRGIVFLPERLYHYRMRAGSTMHSAYSRNASQNLDYVRIANLLWNYFREHHWESKWGGYVIELWGGLLRNAWLFSSDTHARHRISRQVAEFVARESERHGGKVPLRALRALVAAQPDGAVTVKSMGGLLRIRCSSSHRIIRFCGLPVYREKISSRSFTISVLGVPVYRLKAERNPEQWTETLSRVHTRQCREMLPKLNARYDLHLSSPDGICFVMHQSSPCP